MLTTIPNQGDIVVISGYGEQHHAKVGQKSPNGHFSVDWYAGRNNFAPHLVGHWFARFNPDGSPQDGWEIAEVHPAAEKCPVCNGGRVQEVYFGDRLSRVVACPGCKGAGQAVRLG